MNYFASVFAIIIGILLVYQLFKKNVTHSNHDVPFDQMNAENNIKTEDIAPIIETKHEIHYEELDKPTNQDSF